MNRGQDELAGDSQGAPIHHVAGRRSQPLRSVSPSPNPYLPSPVRLYREVSKLPLDSIIMLGCMLISKAFIESYPRGEAQC
jgi:hypothetical protein